MPRRMRHDLLAAADRPRWLVEQDVYRNVLASRYLPPGADLRAELQAAMADRQADGWQVECDGARGFAFCRKAGVRHTLAVVHVDPAGEPVVGVYPTPSPVLARVKL